MNIFGNKRPCIGNLPKRPKMPLSSRNSSIWRPSARRSPITLRIVRQAGNDVRLPRSYTSIRLRRVNALFDISNQPAILTFFQEMEMARTNLSSMSVNALLKLREDIGKVLSSKANELKNQLARLGSETGPRMRGPRSSLKGRRVPIKYRDRSGNTWAGRGAHPLWLREKLKAGAKLDNFAVHKTVASRKAFSKKSKKRRRAKR